MTWFFNNIILNIFSLFHKKILLGSVFTTNSGQSPAYILADNVADFILFYCIINDFAISHLKQTTIYQSYACAKYTLRLSNVSLCYVFEFIKRTKQKQNQNPCFFSISTKKKSIYKFILKLLAFVVQNRV